MKRAAGASFLVTLLCFLSLLQQGVGAIDTHPNKSDGRTHGNHHVTATKSNGKQYEKSAVTVDYSSTHQQHTLSGEKATTSKIQGTTHTETKTGNSAEERNDWKSSHGRTEGNGVAVDDLAVRTEIEERTHTESHGELHNLHSHIGKERSDGHERPAPKTASSHLSAEERTRGEDEVTAVQSKTEAHPIGLINGLEGRASSGRSIALEARELDATTTIIASALIGFVILLFLVFCVAEIAKKRREKKADSTRLLRVFQYLHEFNVDDIDIQLSAAGGFHVGYLNGLAQGINTKKQPDQKTDTSSDEGESGSLSKKV